MHVFDSTAPVQPGHYRPPPAPLAQIEALARGQGIGHLVLVQPSVYGHDNRVLLQALAASGGRHRGVAVAGPHTTDAELDRLHAAGVRGLRFNLVSPVGHGGDALADALRLAPALRARGWHLQWYVQADGLAPLAALQARCALPFVLDHLAGLAAGLPDNHPAWDHARALAGAGAWLKLSGWYRLQASAPYAALHPHIQRAAALFGPRTVWGSDWPHTSQPAGALPPYPSLLTPVRDALGAAPLQALLHQQAAALYT